MIRLSEIDEIYLIINIDETVLGYVNGLAPALILQNLHNKTVMKLKKVEIPKEAPHDFEGVMIDEERQY